MTSVRITAAEMICKYFYNTDNPEYKEDYYEAVRYLLSEKESERIVLYLPFGELSGAPESFKDAYLKAWWNMLERYDVAENFHLGDILEPDARPNGLIPRVVKAAHLTPWLMKSGYMSENDLSYILHHFKDQPILIRSFQETFRFMHDRRLIGAKMITEFFEPGKVYHPRGEVAPLYVSDKRKEWLNELHSPSAKLITPNAHLEGPFSGNISELMEEIEGIKRSMSPDDIIIIGGSKLKGYGTVNSDFDVWNLRDLCNDPEMYPGSPSAAHIFLNGMWIFGENAMVTDQLIKDVLSNYSNADQETRLMSLERIESDLLLYRLLHKGYSRFTGQTTFDTSGYKEIDGDCPFYDDGYRHIATMLFAKYVLLPKSGILSSTRNADKIKYVPFIGGLGPHQYQNTEECNNGKH